MPATPSDDERGVAAGRVKLPPEPPTEPPKGQWLEPKVSMRQPTKHWVPLPS